MQQRLSTFFLVALATLLPVRAQAAPTPAQLCESAMDLASSKYAQCRLNAESKYAQTGDAARRTYVLGQCSTRLSAAFAKAAIKFGAQCPAAEPASAFDAYLKQCSDDTAAAAAGAPLPEYVGAACGNGTVDAAEACDGTDLNGATCAAQGFAGGTLRCASGCTFDTSGCYATRWVDNGDGTATDNTTRLQWELKTDDGSIHDKDNTYTWCAGQGGTSVYCVNPDNLLDGTVATVFLATLNRGVYLTYSGPTTGCFAGHCDWRLPTIDELLGIVDVSALGCGSGSPCTSIPGLTAFSIPESYYYWSLTTYLPPSSSGLGAMVVSFSDGNWWSNIKVWDVNARAVRGGS